MIARLLLVVLTVCFLIVTVVSSVLADVLLLPITTTFLVVAVVEARLRKR